MQASGLPWGKIRYIFISHLHGDHVLGLPPLLTTSQLTGRTLPLDIWSPPGLEDMIGHLFSYTGCRPDFPIQWHEVLEGERGVLLEQSNLEVRTFPLNHRIPTAGYRFTVRRAPGGRPGRDSDLPPDPAASKPYSYAYCSDTAFSEAILPDLQGVDLLYHEATFMEAQADKAGLTGHATARQAGQMALRSRAGRLLLGHFSARYRDLGALLEEARLEFPATDLAEEGWSMVWP
jgi:ribonuclease Z